MNERVVIVDATLEQAERSPGCGMSLEERLRMAHQLERLSQDVIEAGTPMASPGDFEAVRLIASAVERASVAARCLARRVDVDRAWEAIQAAKQPRLHLVAEIPAASAGAAGKVDEVAASVAYAASLGAVVQFTCENAPEVDPSLLISLASAVANAGAQAFVLSDRSGYATPEDYEKMFRALRENRGTQKALVVGAAASNDLGLAVANLFAAVRNGASQVECAVNGIGPRAGVAPLEEFVMLIRSHGKRLGLYTAVNSEEIYRTSRLLSSLVGLPVQRNKPIVGANVFASQVPTGTPQGAAQGESYLMMTPQSIGIKHNTLVLGKYSDQEALSQRYSELGHTLSRQELSRAYTLFRQVAEQKREVFDEDLLAILEQDVDDAEEIYHLENIQVHSGTTLLPTATIELRKGNEKSVDSATGDGPVDAAYKAIERITGLNGRLTEYLIKSVSLGRDGFGEVFVRVVVDGTAFHGRGISTDVITGSAKAYLEALNRAARAKRRRERGLETASPASTS